MAPTIIDTRPVALDGLTEHPENDRVGDVDRVARSLLVNRQYRPIVVQDGTGLVLAGNHVRRAAAMLADGDLPPLPEGYDDPDHDDYAPALVAGVERLAAEGFPPEIVATLVQCTDDEARGILAADNHTADGAGYDTEASLALAQALEEAGMLAAATWDTSTLDDLAAALEEATQATTGPAGYSREGKSLDSQREGYEASGTRSIVLFLGADEYTAAQDRLADLRRTFGVDSNTEVVVRLIRDAHTAAEAHDEAPAAASS